ncbi:class I SAM-dependent methyltransferase [Micromonospora sp. WMMD1102]|uniref:class I SAM-dependent methyltransferase n=1 Tax=Micromonospora sp. WMMD1102 TaxID=3016105 RepID=UPI002415774C|nr:class I SAM-dependent methyltransferase [Micromonospora sp. WMMD1102]MDG4789931.1 class I SAM-dependent methyltransferase [Micromonospora sp. WMMD1102]
MNALVADPPLPPRAALRWHVVRPIVAQCRPATILELGCGLGSVGTRLARLASYTAAEPDPRSFRTAHDRITPLGGTVLNGDHRQVPAGVGYDLVCAFEVLEHIADDLPVLTEWLTLVRPGGRLLLSVPADPERFGPWDTLVGHYRRYSAEQLRQLLLDAGASDVRLVHYGWPLGYLLDSVRDRWAGRPAGQTGGTTEQRTSTSGRILQPRGALAGEMIRMAVSPFALLQRMRPDRGPGLVAVATRP